MFKRVSKAEVCWRRAAFQLIPEEANLISDPEKGRRSEFPSNHQHVRCLFCGLDRAGIRGLGLGERQCLRGSEMQHVHPFAQNDRSSVSIDCDVETIN